MIDYFAVTGGKAKEYSLMRINSHDKTQPSNAVPRSDKLHTAYNQPSLKELLGVAARWHLGHTLSSSEMDSLMHHIRQTATAELEVGDGVKVETVRVERKLDGSIGIFFGI